MFNQSALRFTQPWQTSKTLSAQWILASLGSYYIFSFIKILAFTHLKLSPRLHYYAEFMFSQDQGSFTVLLLIDRCHPLKLKELFSKLVKTILKTIFLSNRTYNWSFQKYCCTASSWQWSHPFLELNSNSSGSQTGDTVQWFRELVILMGDLDRVSSSQPFFISFQRSECLF